jgi:nudix-type nucleoside diphosphatase (YffH/AdpP family)
MLSMDERIAIEQVEVLSDDWGLLKKTTFAYRRGDGRWERHTRETYDRGNGATILLYNRARGTVVLTRQFRLPAYVNGHPGELIEACAGLLDADNAEDCIKRETEEETGYQIAAPKRIFEAFMSPGSVTERLAFFVAAYEPDERAGPGGGIAEEDIAVVELPLAQALAMIDAGEIVDGKTIILLQYAALHGLVGQHGREANQ